MAVTSLWHISGRLQDLIDYVENPEKTVPRGTEDFFNVFSYIKRPEATRDGEYVTAINCLKEIALQQMILTKKQYGKNDKYIAWHGYQSFKIGEIDPDTAHEIGVKLAKQMWGDRFQIIVTTHLDKDHIHNHFCFNSVSFRDGKKYDYTKSEIVRLRDCSDNLCREYGLSVIEHPRKAPSRPVWQDEKAGKPTRYNVYREDIWNAVQCSNNVMRFEKFLVRKGYEVDLSGKHWKLRLPPYKGFTRMDTLDSRWTPQYLQDEMDRTYRSFGSISATVNLRPEWMPGYLFRVYTPYRRTNKIYQLYLFYCYQLGIFPEHSGHRPNSPYLKEELRFLDKFTAQVDYMEKHHIETMDDLYADREKLESELDVLISKRTKLQNKIRRADPEIKVTLREEKQGVTSQITELRKRLKCNQDIEDRSEKIQQNLDRIHENEERNRQLKSKNRSRDAR